MVGDTEFNSNCYYHYFSLDLNQLIENLKGVKGAADIAVKAVPALVRAFCYVSPSGKQNSFAAHQLPSAVCVEIKDEKIPVSYANAFVKTASPGWKGDGLSRKQVNLIEDSVENWSKRLQISAGNLILRFIEGSGLLLMTPFPRLKMRLCVRALA